MTKRPTQRTFESAAQAASALLIGQLLDNVEIDIGRYQTQLFASGSLPVVLRGFVRTVSGTIIRAHLPNAKMGELCAIEPFGRPAVRAQVVGFDEEDIFLTAFDPLENIGPHTPVSGRGSILSVPVGQELLGRVIDSCGEPLDAGGPILTKLRYPVRRSAPKALERERIDQALQVGVRAIDVLHTIGEGQRLGVFSAAGVGKSSLLGMIARNTSADVNVVALVGERGREVQEFLADNLGEEGLRRSVVVVSTSDDTALRRITAAYTATAIAEYFRDCGLRVMLLMDSVTRFARALREIALSLGEPPARQGYPPSVFSTLPELFERAGKTPKGSITGIYTILLGSEQIEDPLGEEIRAILDGHLVLRSKLAQRQHYPAIDILASNSRLMPKVVGPAHLELAETIRKHWAIYEENADLISLGAYKAGSDASIDEAIRVRGALTQLLVQRQDEVAHIDEALTVAKTALKAST